MIRRFTLLFTIQLLISSIVMGATDTEEQGTTKDFVFTSEMIQNVMAKAGEESAKISWSIDHEAYKKLKELDAKLIITYNTKIGKKRAKKNIAGGEWMYTDPIELDAINYKIEDLTGHESYYFKVGFALEGDVNEVKDDKSKMLWSSEAKVKTERGWGRGEG